MSSEIKKNPISLGRELNEEEMCEVIFVMLRKYFNGHVPIDIMHAQSETREDLKRFILKYYKVLRNEAV